MGEGGAQRGAALVSKEEHPDDQTPSPKAQCTSAMQTRSQGPGNYSTTLAEIQSNQSSSCFVRKEVKHNKNGQHAYQVNRWIPSV